MKVKLLKPCYSECAPQTTNMGIIRQFTGNANLRACPGPLDENLLLGELQGALVQITFGKHWVQIQWFSSQVKVRVV